MRKKKPLPSSLKAAFLWLCLAFACISHSQVTPISGVVNSYYSVIEVIPLKTCVRVSSTSGLNTVNKVLIIQMKGASINTGSATSATWGDTTSLNNAGNYEIANICSIRGDSVFFVHQLVNTYTAPAGKVQLVTIAQYDNALVTDTIKAAPWNNSTGTGGIIALDIIDTLQLNAPIYADGLGYQGGAFFQHSGTCDFFNPAGSAYAYDADNFSSSANGAHKGEGVADVTATVDGAKGAPANGGGGGNNHNNSGGGGANLVTGGRGGGNSSSGPFSCITSNNMGLGGKALSSYAGRKLFAGGGGGAGHNNNAIFTLGGGNGGGIVFIHADTLISNGYGITASGSAGGNSQGDGAGGGGAGGTILLDINTYLDAAIISANGGVGGNSNDVFTPSRCFGGGGGGSGGTLYFKGTTPAGTVSTTGGTGGTEIQRDAGCNAAIPGLNGTNGTTVNNYSYLTGTVFGNYCGIILPVTLEYFRVTASGEKAILSWKSPTPGEIAHFIAERFNSEGRWEEFTVIPSNDNQEIYTTTDHQPLAGNNFYRLLIRERNNHHSYSPTRFLYFGKENDYRIYPNPASNRITVSGQFRNNSVFQLFDINGRLLLKKKLFLSANEIELPGLLPGVYVVSVNETSTKLIIR
jgi:hypothetical protein